MPTTPVKRKISELTTETNLSGLYTVGVNQQNQSVRVSLEFLKDLSSGIWLNGTVVPSNSVGENGNKYLRTSTGDIYKKTNDTWALSLNIKGEKGDKGDTGLAGGVIVRNSPGHSAVSAGEFIFMPDDGQGKLYLCTQNISATATNQSVLSPNLDTEHYKLVKDFSSSIGQIPIYLSIEQLRSSSNSSNLIYIIDKGCQGYFFYDSTDTTSIDNLGTILVDNSGKRFKRIYDEGEIQFSWFGGKRQDGNYFNNTPILKNVINFINSIPGTIARINVLFDGYYYFGADLNIPAIKRSNVTFYSKKISNTLFHCHSGTYFTFGDNTSGWVDACGFENITVDMVFANDKPFISCKSMSKFILQNNKFYNVATIIQLGTATETAHDIKVIDNLFVVAGLGFPTIKAVNGTGLYFSGTNDFYPATATVPTMNSTSVMNTLAGTNAIEFSGNWDTANIENCLVQKMSNGVKMATTLSAGNFFQIKIKGCTFDYVKNEPILIDNPNNSVISFLHIKDNYFNSWEADGVKIKTPSLINNVTIDNNISLWNGKSAVNLDSPLLHEFSIMGNKFQSCGRVDSAKPIILLNGGNRGIISKNILTKISNISGESWAGSTVAISGSSSVTNLINNDNLSY